MKLKLQFSALDALAAALLAGATFAAGAEVSPALTPLQGKWSIKKTTEAGEAYSQIIEIRRDKLTFRILGEDQQVRMFAKGVVTTEHVGALRVLKVSNIEAGSSESEAAAVEDVRVSPYQIRDGVLYLVANMDREVENQRPTVDAYRREPDHVKATQAAPMRGVDALAGLWKLTVNYGDNDIDYELRFDRVDGGLKAALISPRSGEHPIRLAELKGDQVTMELNRNLQGNEVTFVYTGKLADAGLTGSLTVKGLEDQVNGTWKAVR